MRVQRAASVALMLYALFLLLALLAPTSTVQAGLVNDALLGFREVLPARWVTFARVEIVMNALIVAPVSLLGSLAWSQVRWQDWVAYGFLGAVSVELFQGLLLPERQASFSDIVANAAGALLGAVLARILFRSPDRGQ